MRSNRAFLAAILGVFLAAGAAWTVRHALLARDRARMMDRWAADNDKLRAQALARVRSAEIDLSTWAARCREQLGAPGSRPSAANASRLRFAVRELLALVNRRAQRQAIADDYARVAAAYAARGRHYERVAWCPWVPIADGPDVQVGLEAGPGPQWSRP